MRSTAAAAALALGCFCSGPDPAIVVAAPRADQAPREVLLDTLWCPMHPNVRSALPGKCPICSMDLVAIPPPRVGQYRLEVTGGPAADKRGERTYRFRVRDPRSSAIVETFTEVHERLLHLFVISRDLRFFAHEHPVRAGNAFELALDLRPGAYMLIADFLPSGGFPQMIHHAVVTPGYARSPFVPEVELDEDLRDKTADGLMVRLSVEGLAVGKEAALRFQFSDAATGAAIRDIQPYLGSSGHLLLVNSDLTQAIHAHPEGAVTGGPDLTFGAVFPAADVYKLWIQVQRGGKVITAPFAVRVGF